MQSITRRLKSLLQQSSNREESPRSAAASRQISAIIGEDRALRHLKQYLYAIPGQERHVCGVAPPKKVWQLWLQGPTEAPAIVRSSLRSVRKYLDDYSIVYLDQNTIQDHLDLPGYVFDKWNQGRMSNVNFSDLLRSCLLAEHGGTWIDATVLLTDRPCNSMITSPFFAFRRTPEELMGCGSAMLSSWFITSSKHLHVMECMKNLLLEYWKHETSAVHHYTFHLFFSLCVSASSACEKIWEATPSWSNVPPHILQAELFSRFNERRFREIKSMSPIHKLTYYSDRFDTEAPDTFYQAIVEQEGDD